MSETEPLRPPALMRLVDAHMYRILRAREDPVGVVEELKGALTESLSRGDEWHIIMLYPILGELSDIVDGYPFDYGEAAEMIAQREIRDAAWDWLRLARTPGDVASYVDRWRLRVAALPASCGGRPFP